MPNDDSDSSDAESMASATGERLWDTLEHNGIIFTPPYEPHGKPIRYQGQTITMHPEAEEVATMFACMRESPYYLNEIFRKNFFLAWRALLHKHHRDHPIKNLDLVDFDEIFAWFLEQQRIKKERTPQEKKKIREEVKAAEAPYSYCIWNGNKEPLSRYKVEPPGLFRGRGAHPLAGCLKKRVVPEEVTINIGEEAVVPQPPPGHSWKAVIHDHTVAWTAMWRDSVTDGFKYVYPGPGSTFKSMSDMKKFDRARRLALHINRIRESYQNDWESPDRGVAQRAVAMYFIDILALRVGNEKGEDEADTVGCCSLRVEHITLIDNNTIKFDFLGKDSIRYQNEVEVNPRVYALLARFIRQKRPEDDVFDALTTTSLNEHLKSFMPELSAKVFRTYNASRCLEDQLRLMPKGCTTTMEKMEYFNRANTKVAVLCNHQRALPRGHHATMATMAATAEALARRLRRIAAAADIADADGMAAARAAFYADEDAEQREWLRSWGTPEECAAFEAAVKERNAQLESADDTPPTSQRKAKSTPTQRTPSKPTPSKSTPSKSPGRRARDDAEDGALADVLRGRGVKRDRDNDVPSAKGKSASTPSAKGRKVEEGKPLVKRETATQPKAVKKEEAEPPKAGKGGSVSAKLEKVTTPPKAASKKSKVKREDDDEEAATLGSLI